MDGRNVPGPSLREDRALDDIAATPFFGFNWHDRDQWKRDPDPMYDRAVAKADHALRPAVERERAEARCAALQDGWLALWEAS